MTTNTDTPTRSRHDTATRFLTALAGDGARGELIELRYRLDDGYHMGQVFERPQRVRGMATRAITLGRRTDVYVGCAPRTRRHGGRDAVDRAFAVWADCDGEHAVAALHEFNPEPSIVIASAVIRSDQLQRGWRRADSCWRHVASESESDAVGGRR